MTPPTPETLREEIRNFISLKRLTHHADGSVSLALKPLEDQILALIEREKRKAVEEAFGILVAYMPHEMRKVLMISSRRCLKSLFPPPPERE